MLVFKKKIDLILFVIRYAFKINPRIFRNLHFIIYSIHNNRTVKFF